MNKSKIHMFCIGHTKISLPVPDSAYLIRTSRGFIKDNAHQNLISLDEVSVDLDFYYPYLGGTAGLFAVEEMITSGSIHTEQVDKVMIFQQGKFVSLSPVEKSSSFYKSAGIISESEAKKVDLVKMFDGWNGDFLFCDPSHVIGRTKVGTIGENYALAHGLPDFLKFFSIAIEMGVITSDEFVDIFNDNVLIPGGGALGVFPISFFVEHIKKLKLVSLAFLDFFRPSDRSKIGRISAGYCCERLGSFLLKKFLIKEYGVRPVDFYGQLVIVVPDGEDYIPGSSYLHK